MIHTLRLPIPNVFLVTGEKAILIDAGGPKDVPRIRAFLKTHGIEKLSLILLTHGHWDHAGGAAELKKAIGAPIAIHRADADLVRKGTSGPLKPTSLLARVILPLVDRPYPAFEPDVLIDDERDLGEFGVAARVLFTPGHTPGSISVLTDDREAVVGDLLIGGWLGGWFFRSRPGMHYNADDLDQVRASIAKVLAAGPRLLHVGHGGPLDARDVARFLERK